MKVYAEWNYNREVALLDVLEQLHISCGVEDDEDNVQWDGFMADSDNARVLIDIHNGSIRMEHDLSEDMISAIMFAMIEEDMTFWLSPDTALFGEATSFGIDYE